jgi:uncharacterized membrane protein (UPF0136 family)
MLTPARYALFAYALFVAVGGVMGFVEKKSAASLAGGLVCGIIAAAGALQIPARPAIGLGLGIAAAAIGASRPAMTLSKGTLSLWPGGALLGTSALVLLLCLAALLTKKG